MAIPSFTRTPWQTQNKEENNWGGGVAEWFRALELKSGGRYQVQILHSAAQLEFSTPLRK